MERKTIREVTQKITLPTDVRYICDKLENAGYEAYAVGGCVRDSLLGVTPKDWDITTSALPEDVKKIFGRTIDTGLQHGTVTVMRGGTGYEVTTYRIDGDYGDGRHPDNVRFTSKLEEDLCRRDFTINAMAYNERDGLVDLFGGCEDLEKGIIRSVGRAEERFGEDALRMMRAIRFSARLGFAIDDEIIRAIDKLHDNLKAVSAERITTELIGIICSDHPDRIRIAYETGLTSVFFPEFDKAMETPQKHIHHKYDVGDHIIESMKSIAPDKVRRLSMLLHDIGKPETLRIDENGITHFKGHCEVGAEMGRQILRRWKLDNNTVDSVVKMIRYHDYGNDLKPTPKNVRRAIAKIGKDLYPMYIEVKHADTLAQSDYMKEEKLAELKEWKMLYDEIISKGECVEIRDLAIGGNDLMEEGFKPGPEIGRILNELLKEVIDDPAMNTKEILISRAKSISNEK